MMTKIIQVCILLQLFTFYSYSQEIKMKGIITDSETKIPIHFVNIGFLNKNKGTISNLNGEFILNVSEKFLNDSLTISHVNYYPIKIPIDNFNNRTIFLEPRTNELSEVIVTNKRKINRKVGVNIYLRAGFESDSSFVRVNFYKNLDNKPAEKIVFENIVKKKRIEPGWLQIDLTEYYVYLEEDFFVGVEFIPDFKNSLDVYIGAILTKGKGYSRSSSQGKWNKLQGASTINVEIEY